MRSFPALLAALATLPAWAHDLWLECDAGGLTLYQGHRHSSHGGADTIPYDESFVREAVALDADGRKKVLPVPRQSPWRITTTDQPEGRRTPRSGGPERSEGWGAASQFPVVRVATSSGYWTKTPWETKNVPKTGVAGAIRSWRSEESVKRIDRWIPGADRPLSGGLEITPATDPFVLRPGDKLVVVVTDNGEPRAGVPVAYDGETRGATGNDGRIAIRLRHGGMQMISASIETPLSDGKADVLIRSAILQFELPK